MSAGALLAELRRRGVEVRARGDQVLYRPRDAVSPELRERLRASKEELLRELCSDRLLEQFLGDEAIPAAVFHSSALNRRFVLARDEAALDALTEADRVLPVLFFGEAEKLRRMGLEGLRALLEFRQEFGPSLELYSVKVPNAWRRA
jgi:hypothetical protein